MDWIYFLLISRQNSLCFLSKINNAITSFKLNGHFNHILICRITFLSVWQLGDKGLMQKFQRVKNKCINETLRSFIIIKKYIYWQDNVKIQSYTYCQNIPQRRSKVLHSFKKKEKRKKKPSEKAWFAKVNNTTCKVHPLCWNIHIQSSLALHHLYQ